MSSWSMYMSLWSVTGVVWSVYMSCMEYVRSCMECVHELYGVLQDLCTIGCDGVYCVKCVTECIVYNKGIRL